jgi:hypothetical protein
VQGGQGSLAWNPLSGPAPVPDAGHSPSGRKQVQVPMAATGSLLVFGDEWTGWPANGDQGGWGGNEHINFVFPSAPIRTDRSSYMN